MEADTKFEEKILETDRLRLVRIKAETHGAELNRVICDTFDTLSPWMVWCKTKPTVEVNFADQIGSFYIIFKFYGPNWSFLHYISNNSADQIGLFFT